jgi:hypothetical protein
MDGLHFMARIADGSHLLWKSFKAVAYIFSSANSGKSERAFDNNRE